MAFLMNQFGAPTCYALAHDALVVEFAPPHSLERQSIVWSLHAAACAWPGVRERVPGLNNFTVQFDPSVVSAKTLRERLLDLCVRAHEAIETPSRTHELAVSYGGADGPDLADLGERLGCAPREIVERHLAREYRVYFLGFAPGFAYLGDLDPALHVPRRAQPRTRVPAGSVAIAGSQTAVYPATLPGGWHLIGRTQSRLFDPNGEPPVLLRPGDRVRFVEMR